MINLPGNPFAEGPDNYRETLHELGKSHLAYEISATLALAYEQRTANLIAYIEIIDDTDHNTMNEIKTRLGLGENK